MFSLSSIILGALAGVISQTLAAPLIVHPGTAKDIVITNQDTVNATDSAFTNTTTSGSGQLSIQMVNNFAGSVNAYVTGLDPNNQLVLLQTDGTWLYPQSNGASTPQPISGNVAIPLGAQGSTTTITLPDYISAGRVWFAANGELQFFTVQGASGPSLVEPSSVNPQDPSADVNWGFVELTNTEEGGLYCNISYVDFVGLPLGMSVTGSAGTQNALGLPANAVTSICNDLKTQAAADGQPWDQLCVSDSNGNPLRIIAPSDYASVNPSAFSDYWTDYVNQVWQTYSSQPLTINTQAAAGDVTCTVSGGTLNCEGDNRGYAQPVASDIWGCNSGPFAIESGDNAVHYAVVPRLCAAFDRSTLLMSGGNAQPSLDSNSYYTTSPTNRYSQFVHKYELDGRGYAFPYDDVNADGSANASGELSDARPQSLTITVGGPTN
ncbi:MAG: hypothetical protein M1821_008340 [Bathelium mastoideum]|nr:MAG: hypothetical protein M1821_008340 [Bathelium mastoideum]KAI9693379.1 MAG: hypothetical protein M1822_005375 [Bathelium mastoideum]